MVELGWRSGSSSEVLWSLRRGGSRKVEGRSPRELREDDSWVRSDDERELAPSERSGTMTPLSSGSDHRIMATSLILWEIL
ncbi:hypothetical protein EAG_05570 [Camponotus floridanus]|uniref:Uncharacterized protein n=1 Tax=Camponotus floridanus TaxID=104421 RepID=E2AEX1_CAMFO|nr:hypothetical protein EAG_05570 [Camponotus floridanus]